MRHLRYALYVTFAVSMIPTAYVAGGYTAGLLVAGARAIAPSPAPVSIEMTVERVAAR